MYLVSNSNLPEQRWGFFLVFFQRNNTAILDDIGLPTALQACSGSAVICNIPWRKSCPSLGEGINNHTPLSSLLLVFVVVNLLQVHSQAVLPSWPNISSLSCLNDIRVRETE